MVEDDKSGNLKLLVSFVAGTAVIVAIIITVQGAYLDYTHRTEAEIAGASYPELLSLRKTQNEELSQYRDVPSDVKDGPNKRGIPLDKAISLVIKEEAAKAIK
jgi:hypothetical protein